LNPYRLGGHHRTPLLDCRLPPEDLFGSLYEPALNPRELRMPCPHSCINRLQMAMSAEVQTNPSDFREGSLTPALSSSENEVAEKLIKIRSANNRLLGGLEVHEKASRNQIGVGTTNKIGRFSKR
ncbi:MAG: hypothetical protein ACRD2L_00925, partial [Terriglobia bacterium]